MPWAGPLLVFLAAGTPLLAAFVIDMLLGDPKEGSGIERIYPPVLLGRLGLGLSESIPRKGTPRKERALGALVWGVVVGIGLLLSLLFVLYAGPALRTLVTPTSWSGESAMSFAAMAVLAALYLVWLKSLFTMRGLLSFCLRPLGKPLEEKRALTARVVNRETRELPEGLLHSALVESLAENTTDSVVSPLLYYAFLGLPGAVLYRTVNTLDALLGHTDPRWINVGAVAARVDHWMNLPGDRLSGAFLGGAGHAPVTLQGSTREVPASIRSLSSALTVRLEKTGCYIVGADRAFPTEEDVRRAARKVQKAGYLTLAVTLVIMGGLAVVGWTFFL